MSMFLWTFVALCAIGAVVCFVLGKRERRKRERERAENAARTADQVLGLQVWDALDRSVENGYVTWLRRAAVPEIADDLLDHDSDFEDCTRKQLEPHVRSWRAQDRL